MPKASKLFAGVRATESVEVPARPHKPIPPSRAGKRTIVLRMDPDAFQVLRKFAFESDRSIQHVAMEAFNLLFAKYGLPPLA